MRMRPNGIAVDQVVNGLIRSACARSANTDELELFYTLQPDDDGKTGGDKNRTIPHKIKWIRIGT